MQWVIDTDVLVRAENRDNQHNHSRNVVNLLESILKKGFTIAVDQDHMILREYWRHLKDALLVGQYLRAFTKTGQFDYLPNEFTVPVEDQLRVLKFDPDDFVFVAVALQTADKLLVAEESDYTADVVAYLATEGVAVMDCAEAVAAVSAGGR